MTTPRDDIAWKELGQRTDAELESMFGDMYAGWDRGVNVPATKQSRSKSLLETVTSTAIGFAVSLLLTATVMPAFGYPTTWAHDFWITMIFTVASIVRGYAVRRCFNG